MLRRRYATVLVSVITVGLALSARAVMDDKDKPEGGTKALPSCPVMDEPIDISVSTPSDQGPVYFCCADCVKKYSEKPEKYAAKVAEQRKALADRPKVQVSCPLDGQPVDSKVSIEEKGQKVYFCCDKCPAEYQKDPAKYAAKLANAYTYQTLCPVMKEEIDPAVFADLPTEQRVYFCCKKCVGKFKESPEKYVAALETQGMYVDPEKAKGK